MKVARLVDVKTGFGGDMLNIRRASIIVGLQPFLGAEEAIEEAVEREVASEAL